MLSPSQSFRIPPARREESFSLSKAPASPPLPPLRKGGKGIARSRRHSIARNKNTRLETVPPVRSTPTFHQPSVRLWLRLKPLSIPRPPQASLLRPILDAKVDPYLRPSSDILPVLRSRCRQDTRRYLR